MRILLNGEKHEVDEGTTVAALVAMLGLEPGQVAVECNRRLVPRAARDEVVLAEGDAVELVTLVGGG